MKNVQVHKAKARFSALLPAAEAFRGLWNSKTNDELDLVAPEDLPPIPILPL